LLKSNGRLETDLLDQLSELLASGSDSKNVNANSNAGSSLDFPSKASSHDQAGTSAVQQEKKSSRKTAASKPDPEPAISAPMPGSDANERTSSSSSVAAGLPSGLPSGLSSERLGATKGDQNKPVNQSSASLQAEAESLEEILKNQAHPKNLVAVKKSGTAVVSTPSLNGKTLFLASAQDEFEMLDFNSDWVHVRISGLSRGWIWRTSLEMPEGISDVPKAASTGASTIADLFQVSREERAPFPGDWEPLRGKKVKIISVQKVQENEKDSGAQAKLEYAKSLIDKNYAELAAESRDLAGIVLIFDSVDGGMIAATISTVQAWKAGTLSDAALWHQCYFDPPETFTVSSNPSSGH
jgi:hypothetical protein